MVSPPDLVLRPIGGSEEVALFNQLPYTLNDEIAGDLLSGRRRPEWLWVALRGDRVVARAGWWARPGADQPAVMDIFDFAGNGSDDSVKLLETALPAVVPAGETPPEYGRYLPADWRDRPESRRPVEDRMAVLEQFGARLFVERLRLEWRAGDPVPEDTGRLSFRPVDDPGELIDLMTLVLDGTLDAHSRDDLARMTARESAKTQYDDLLASEGGLRGLWRIATTTEGEPVGFVLPVQNGYNAVIGYIAVVPAQRGHGYIDEVLGEATRLLVAHDVPRIRAATDLGNGPMAEAFARAGYRTFERKIDMTWL